VGVLTAGNGRTTRAATLPLRVLITSGGGPGAWGLISALRNGRGQRMTVLAHDPAEHATLGALFADAATRLPPAADARYVDALLAYCTAERVDVLVPVFDGELLAIARRRDAFERGGTSVLLPPLEVIETCCDKARTYSALDGTPFAPPYRLAITVDESLAAIAALGYPRRVLVVRPVDLAGGRGLNILDAQADAFREHLLSKPGPHRLTAEAFLRIRAAGPQQFPLLVSEFLPGEELGIDLLAEGGHVIELVIRRKSGPVLHGNPTCIAFDEQPREREWLAGLAGALGLSGLLSIDARYDGAGVLRLLEVNPRPGAYIGMSCARLDLLSWAIDRLAGERNRTRADYVVDESLTGGLRALGDVMFGERSSAVLSLERVDAAAQSDLD
jgi:carbamoyl-phosphate synthase large subunit